ncbi:MAG: 3',5'-cyclic-AMP phosphodiesterase [Halieaceae bacterium]
MSSGVRKITTEADCLHLLQVTDTHLSRDEGGTLLGLDTDFSLQQVIQLAQRERGQFDLVLATGDISDHGAQESYIRAAAYMDSFNAPVAWLVGNHDCADTMTSTLGGDEGLDRALQAGSWLIVMLNSQIPGEVGGELGPEELEWLQRCLDHAATESLHCLVCLHHHPVPMNSGWIDEQMVADREAFFALLDQYDCVRGVLWGHVHQLHESERSSVKLMSTPSSCIQFAPGSHGFKVDDQPPGYRWLDLYADGRIETGISRVQDVEFSVDLDSSGYL